jgi:hypothetical protein
MSTVKLNPEDDLKLGTNVAVPVVSEQYPRELGMDAVNQQVATPVTGFTGIMDISSAKDLLKPAQTTSSTSGQVTPPQPANAQVVSAQTSVVDASLNHIAEGTAEVHEKVSGSNIPVIISLVLFLCSLGAAVYFLVQYFMM